MGLPQTAEHSRKISICRQQMGTPVPVRRTFFRMNWKNYSEGTRPLKASEARRIGKVGYENIVRSSTFHWTPQKRNGYYSKQKNSSMRVCDAGKKRFGARRAEKLQQQKIIDARSRLRSEEAVIYSPRFVIYIPHFSDRREIRTGPQWGRPRIQLGGRAAWASFFWLSSG